MREQTGEQYRSIAVPGKKQNCPEWGTFEPAMSDKEYKYLCHGGWYMSEYYHVCPVREECKTYTISRKPGLVVNPAGASQQAAARAAYRVTPFEVPDLGRLPTQMPRGGQPTPQGVTPQQAAAAQRAAQQAAAQGFWTNTVIPPDDAPPGMRTPHMASSFFGDVSPTFLPGEGESTLERLLLNILQGMISAIAFHVWNFLRSVDLFG